MTVKPWLWKSFVAGLAGALAHSALMYFKARTGLLSAFQPYESLQAALSRLVGAQVHPVVPWALSFANGATILGFLFGRFYPHLPGKSGAVKGASFGLLGWVLMGLIFFPLVGLGPFALYVELGLAPAVFSLAMLLVYSVVMGIVYAALNR